MKSVKKKLCGFLAIVLLLTSVQWNVGSEHPEAAGKEIEAPSIAVDFNDDLNSGSQGTKADSGLYLLGNNVDMILAGRYMAGYTQGYVTDAYMILQLPYLYYQGDKLMMSYTKPQNIPDDQLMGIEAKATDDNWLDVQKSEELGVIADLNTNLAKELIDNSTYDSESGYHRGSIVMKTPSDYEVDQNMRSVNFHFRFFGNVPENASAQIKVGAAYGKYHDPYGNESKEGFLINPGEPTANESANDYLRIINIVNSNLVWEPQIDLIKTSVMWDKYNYMVYKVRVENKSEDTSSQIDHFALNFGLQSAVKDPSKGGVLEQDMMRWRVKDDGSVVENTGTSDQEHEYNFTGKPNEGGVLIYDVTDIPEEVRDKWDLNKFEGEGLPDPLTYAYPTPGVLGLDIQEPLYAPLGAGGDKKAAKEYYIAIPYPNNFTGSKTNSTNFRPTIYFGGRDLSWSKTAGDYKRDFLQKRFEFVHRKYVLTDEEAPKVADKKEVPIGSEQTYYLDSFNNIGNVPVFNAKATDTLPDKFDLTKIEVTLNKNEDFENPELSDWFRMDKQKAEDFLYFEFKNAAGEVKELSAKTLLITGTESADADGNKTWTYNAKEALEKYIKDHTGWTFEKKLHFYFKERIDGSTILPVDKEKKAPEFNGRIGVSGNVEHLLTYVNKIDTSYEHWYYRVATSEETEGYEVEKKKLDSKQASLTTKRAAPVIEGHGVFHDTDEDTVSAGGAAQDVPLNEDVAGVRFNLGNTSTSQIKPGYLKISPIMQLSADGKNQDGLEVSSIRLSKPLCERMKTGSIIFTDEAGRKVTLNSSALNVNGNGELIIYSGSWKKNGFSQLVTVEFQVNSFLGNSELDDEAYVEINGAPNQAGSYAVDAFWETRYNLDDVEDDKASAKAMLNVSEIKPYVTGTAHYEENSGKNVTAPNKKDAWYDFVIENRSKSAAGHVNVDIDLESVGNKESTPAAPKMLKGFRTNRLVLEPGYVNSGVISYIKFFDWDQDPSKDVPDYIMSMEDLENNYKKADGSIEIPASVFPSNLEMVKYMRIEYARFTHSVAADADSEKDTALRLSVYGKTDWFNELKGTCSFVPTDRIYTSADIVKDSASVTVPEPGLALHSHIMYDNVEETSQNSAPNSDNNEMITGVPYDRDFMFRTEALNESLSVLDDVDMTVEAPMTAPDEDGKIVGFHVNKLKLYKDMTDQFGAFKYIILNDADSKKAGIKLTYDETDGTFRAEDGTVFTIKEDDTWEWTADELNALGITNLKSVKMSGTSVELKDSTEEGRKRYVEFYGYEDAAFGTKEVLKADSTNYLDGIRTTPAYQIKAADTAAAYISKMYFDTTITAGYNDNNAGAKFDRTSSSIEHVRSYYSGSSESTFGDNSELEIGYKGLGSYMVDFRQYLNVGGSLPAGSSSQEHQSMPYVKLESLNTAANVNVEVKLPKDSFEAYYLKLDPKVKDYIRHVTVTRKDGSTYKLEGADLKYEAKETRTEGSYCRLNLLKPDESTRFTDEETDFYRTPQSYQGENPENPVTGIVVNFDINQEQNTKAEDGTVTANRPDFGTWYKEGDESSKYMFEVSGRFYKLGGSRASAVTTLNVGGGRSKERTDSGSSNAKSSFSYRNYYRYWTSWHSSSYEAEYTAGHLVSDASVAAVRNDERILKGATTSPTKEYNDDADFGQDNQFLVSFYRKGRTDRYYESSEPHRYNLYEVTNDRNSNWKYQDQEDWYGKLGYTDEVILRDTLPTIRPNDTYGYYGFLTTGLEMKPAIAKYVDSVELKLNNVDKNGGKTQAKTVTLTKEQLKEEGGALFLNFIYPGAEALTAPEDGGETKPEEGPAEEPAGSYKLEEGQFVISYDIHLKDMMGNGEYNKEVGLKGTADANGGNADADLAVHGKPYTITKKDPNADGTNYMKPLTKTHYDKATEYENILFKDYDKRNTTQDNARLMGFLIDFHAGYKLQQQNTRSITEYAANNIDPNIQQFGVKVYNQSRDNATGKDAVARVSEANSTNTLDSHFRLQHIYIPKFLVDEDWFKAQNLKITANGKTVPVELIPENLESRTVAGTDCYVVNIEEMFRKDESLLTKPENNMTKTNNVDYVAAFTSKFTLDFKAVDPKREDGTTVLENKEFITENKTDGYTYWYDGVYVDRTLEDFKKNVWTENSAPSFGRNPNKYTPYDTGTSSLNQIARNYVDFAFASVDPNANKYTSDKNTLTDSQKSDYFNVTNRVATLVTRTTRTRNLDGGGAGFAYDNDDNQTPALEVDKDHLMPYDYIEYEMYVKNDDTAILPLQRPYLNFRLQEGQRLVKWEVVENTTDIPNEKITGTMQVDDTTEPEVEVRPEIDYSINKDGSDNFYRKLKVTVGEKGARLQAGKMVKIRITTQLTDEKKKDGKPAYEGEKLQANSWVTADPSHNYPQYAIESRGDIYGTGSYRKETDLGGEVAYTRNYSQANASTPQNQVYEARAVSDLTFKNNKSIEVAYQFDDPEYEYDEQGAALEVTKIKNDTRHYANEMTVTVSFLDSENRKGFTLTEVPEIKYPSKLPANADRKDIKIEYCTEITADSETWKELPKEEAAAACAALLDNSENEFKEKFLRNAKKIRWTYYDINAVGTDGAELEFDKVVLTGVGSYEDIRKDADTSAMPEKYEAVNTGTIEHKHFNNEIKTVADGDTVAEAKMKKELSLTEEDSYEKYVYRENPQVQFYTQSFESEADVPKTPDMTAAQKTGYRPGDTIWQKVTLINQHMVSGGAQNKDQGVLLNPVIYDKLPEYLSSSDLDSSNFQVVWKDINGDVKNEGMPLEAKLARTVKSDDFGGAMIYKKSSESGNANSNIKGFDDLKPDINNSEDIDFNVYELRFDSGDGKDVRVEVGDTIEIWYSLKVRDDDLPMVYVKEADGTTHPAYFPRNGEYYHYSDNYGSGASYPLVVNSSDGYRRVENENRMMDMDYLLHDIGLSADKNEQVDRWEFLNESTTLIPGTSADNETSDPYIYGNNGVLIDEDASVLNKSQKVTYSGKTSNKNSDALPDQPQLMTNSKGRQRDWYNLVLAKRTQFDQNWDGELTDTRMPILWSETRLHLQKAWLATSSEIKSSGKNRKHESINPDYAWNTSNSNSYYYNTVHDIIHDNNTVALEYNEDFTTTLQALNYGDWGLDGVEFTYTMPRGVRPRLKDDGTPDLDAIKAKLLTGLSGTSNSFADISGDLVEVSVLQKPGDSKNLYHAAKAVQDPIWSPETDKDSNFYPLGEDSIDTEPWVLKITVKQPLKKWFNRGSASGYKISVDIPCNVYRTNDNEYWYDRVITRPYVAENSQNHSYYQIYDIDHWEGINKVNPHNQKAGMDYFWYAEQAHVNDYRYYNGSPNMPYVNGYNIQNNEVQVTDSDPEGSTTDNKYGGYAKADRDDLYAQTGTRAIMRKPLIRLWATSGDDLTGKTRDQYYMETEGDKSKINIHVENKYWWDSQSSNGESGYNYSCERTYHNYNTDGGSKGTLTLPVVTNILPYGIAPLDKDGKIFTKDNDENARMEVNWSLYNGAGTNVLTAEQDKYTASVRYELINMEGSGEKEGRFVITFTPKADANAGDREKEARIASDSANIFSVDTFTYDMPKVETKDGDKEELYRNYEDNRTYVTSKIDGFKYLTDEDIPGNVYTVGSPSQLRWAYYGNYIRDNRMDAIMKTHSWTYGGNHYSATMGSIPDDKLKHTFEDNTFVIGSMKKYSETDELNVEDYTEDVSGASLRDPLKLSDSQKDFDQSGSMTHKDYKTGEELSDIGVMNTMKLRTKAPRLVTENYVSDKHNELGRKDGEEEDIPAFQYSDSVWYGAKVINTPSAADNYYEQGAVHHGKMVVSFHLPKNVSYYGTADWNIQNNDGDQYNNPDDFYLEYYDSETKQTTLLSQKELREQGWGVEVIADSSKEWEEDRVGHDPQTVTFEITTPKSEDFTDYTSYIKGEKPAGYFASGSYMNLRIRTRVDNEEAEGLKETPDVWSGYTSQVYVTTHNGDGKYALDTNGTFVKKAEDGTVTVPDGLYNGYEVAVGDYDFGSQPAASFFGGGDTASDSKDDKGDITDDMDLDGEYDSFYVTGKSAAVNVTKPGGTIRLDTSKLRYRANDPMAEREIMEDPHVRSAYNMQVRMDQAVNEKAALNSFIVNYNVPYYGTNKGTSGPASMLDSPMKPTIHEIRTGAWELPEEVKLSDDADQNKKLHKLYNDHLKVKMFILVKDDPWAENANYYPGVNDSSDWQQIGEAGGYSLKDNAVITVPEELKSKIFQIRWIVQMEAFSDDENSYNVKQAPIYYPVPKGFRIDIDADGDSSNGKQEMDEVDPERKNKEEPARNVKDNSAHISLNLEQKSDDGSTKHNNHLASIFPGYDDSKFGDISGSARAGYYVDPEVPTVNVGITTYYFGGGAAKGYEWNDDVIVDSNSSNMLKYKAFYENIDLHNEYSDQASNPSLTVVLPYMEKLRKDDFKYVDYRKPSEDGSGSEDYYIGDDYKAKKNLDKETPLWTWHVEDADGNIVTNSSLKLVENYPTFRQKQAYISSKTLRKIVSFNFEGKLGVGQKVVVEFMVPIESTDAGAVPTDMLECRAFGFKKGSFEPYLDNEGSGYGNIGYELDSNDLNDNSNKNEYSVSRTANGIAFKTTEGVVQNKTASSILDMNISKRAVPVNEAGDYNFKASMVNKSGSTSYKKLLFYDVLPYNDDHEIMNGTGASKDTPIPRNSNWHGWIKPDSIQVTQYSPASTGTPAAQQIIDPKDYEVWVGPIVKEDGKYVNKGIEGLPSRDMMADLSTYNRLIDDDSEKQQYFVKLNDLLKETSGAEQENLIKAIRSLWVEMNDEEMKIEPACRLELSYDMHEPINVERYMGTPVVSGDQTSVDVTQAYNDIVAANSGWNTFISKSGVDKTSVLENIKAGVYVNAPAERGYIGSYVWEDADYSAKPDDGEGGYGTVDGMSRVKLKNRTTDLDFDGENDDPGINGVKVELLTEAGYPCNMDGEPVMSDPGGSGKYVVIDETTGNPAINDMAGTMIYSMYGPLSFTTESDYYDNEGYFILSNLKPGKYNLRYTFPEEYNEYSATTLKLGETKTPVAVYRDGEKVYDGGNNTTPKYQMPDDRLVVQTADPVEVKAVGNSNDSHKAYDDRMTSYNVGIGRAYTYGGYAWLDETTKLEDDGKTETIESDGYMDKDGVEEKRLSGIEVSVYNIKDRSKPCLDGNGNPAVYTTKDKDKGYFQFRLKPGEKYVVVARDVTGKDENGDDRLLKPTPWTYESNPLTAGDDNDLSKLNGIFETRAFEAKIPYDDAGKPVFADKSTQTFVINKNIGLGLINGGRGYLGKFVWDDADYDGIMDEDEEGIPDVEITLESYYYDDAADQWVKFGTDRTKTTNKAGAYIFDNVMSYHVEGEKTYLAGYKLRIDEAENEEVFKKYGVTHYQVNEGVLDSDLVYNGLTMNKGHIIIAEEATDATADNSRITYNGKEYDISDAKIVLDYDAGLSEYQYGKVDGIVWSDTGEADGHRYNGILDEDEKGIEGITVHLEQYIRDTDGNYQPINIAQAMDGSLVTGEKIGTTDADGRYRFDRVPGFVLINGGKHLCYYRIKADIKDGYGVTRYQQTVKKDGTNSDWITNQYRGAGNENYLTAPDAGDYFMIAQPAKSLVNPNYTVTEGGKKYDIIRKKGDVSGYDGGLVDYPDGSLTGVVWEDADYDGIRDENEQGIKDISVSLKRYYYDGNDWKEDTAFTEKSDTTKEDGSYQFKDLDTQVKVGDDIYLAGYKVSMVKVPDEYGVTRYRQGKDRGADSDLRDMDAPLAMTREDEYIPAAAKAVKDTGGNKGYNSSSVKITDADGKEVWYDLLTAEKKTGFDAGLVKYPTGKLTGYVWEDKDYDGIRDAKEAGVKDAPISLERWYYDTDGKTWIKDEDFSHDMSVTTEDGIFLFENLDTRVLKNGVSYLAGYRIELESLDENYGCTYYRLGDDRSKDSDLISGGTPLNMQRENEYIPTAKTAEVNAAGGSYNSSAVKFVDADKKTVYYDMLTAREADSFDAGLVKFPEGLIQGRIWDDKDYDGIQDADEKGIPGLEVELRRYYYKDGEWLEDEKFEILTSKTSSFEKNLGRYAFTELKTQVKIDDVNYLAGYTLRLKALPDDKAITRRQRGKDPKKDSDLQYGTLSLTKPGEYIVTAAAPDKNKPLNQHTVVALKNSADQKVTYDMLKNQTVTGYDGGLSDYTDGRIAGTIWDDKDYDGILSEGEEGIKNVEVILERYIKDGDGWKKDEGFTSAKALTQEDGTYEFDGLKSYFAEGEHAENKYLYGYKLKVNDETLPENYGITRYQQAEKTSSGEEEKEEIIRDSDLIAGNTELTKEDEYLLVVGDAVGSQNPDYIVEDYDVVKGITVDNYDGGLTRYQTGSISGKVWKDENYDGIQDEKEKGMKDMKVQLERWYYDGTKWHQDENFVKKAVTKGDGSYLFEELPTTVTVEEKLDKPNGNGGTSGDDGSTDNDSSSGNGGSTSGSGSENAGNSSRNSGEGNTDGGDTAPDSGVTPPEEPSKTVKKTYIAGYLPKLVSIPETYAVSKYRQGKDEAKDSDLNPGTLTLTKEGTMLIPASSAEKGIRGEYNDTALKAAADSKKQQVYDPVRAEDIGNCDGGLTPFEAGEVEGTVWKDEDGDGIFSSKEDGISGIRLILTQYERIDGTWQQVEGFSKTVKTGRDGAYRFGKLPLFAAKSDENGEKSYHLLGYRLSAESLPEDMEITGYRKNGGKDDSLLKEKNDEVVLTDKKLEMDGCIILAQKKDKTTNPYYAADKYDLVKPREEVVMNAGLTEDGAVVISLNRWFTQSGPQTGDFRRIWPLLLLLILSGAAEGVYLYRKRKKRA